MVTDASGARGQRPAAVLRGKGRLAAGAAAKERTSNRGRRCGATEALRSSAGPGLTGEPGSPEQLVLKYIWSEFSGKMSVSRGGKGKRSPYLIGEI